MKTFINITLFVVSILFLSGCKTDLKKQETIFVSIEPQKFFLEHIVKDKYTVNTIISDGSNPETYDPTPAQMVAVGKSKLYFKIGYLNFENAWISNIQKNNPLLKISNCSKSIQPINPAIDGHGHSHNHGHEGPDPHLWSSPKTALIIAQNMRDEVINHDPANKAFYEENYKELSTIIYETDSIIKNYLEKAPSHSFIIYHPALSYFANEYNLCQFSIEHEGKQPTPVELKALVNLAKTENIKVVFIQAEYDAKNAETLAKEIGAKVVPINLLSYNWNEEMIKIAKALALENE